MTDQELIASLCDHASGAVEALLHRYTPLLRYVIRGILPPEEVDDCLSDVTLRLMTFGHSYDPGKGTLPAWLTTIARNAALDHRSLLASRQNRETSLDPAIPDPTPGPEASLLQKERTGALHDALCRLNHSDQILFYRKYWYEQPTVQIAAELGMTPRAVEGRLYRLRRKLKKLLGGDFL